MCSSLLRDPWPCYAGPLVKSRDYLKKKKNGEFILLLRVFCIHFILEAETEFPFLH